MKEATDLSTDYRYLVRTGYDTCAELYAAARREDDSEPLTALLVLLPKGSSVLDLGCGAGQPIAESLSRWHNVTGVDASEKMLGLARAAVPGASFVHGDILKVDLAPSSFDAIVAMYVLFHLPREEHAVVFDRIWTWLRPGGYFLVTLTEEAEDPYTEDDFFGTEMYWSSLGLNRYKELLADMGFELLGDRIVGHGYGRAREARDERHPTLLVQKPRD